MSEIDQGLEKLCAYRGYTFAEEQDRIRYYYDPEGNVVMIYVTLPSTDTIVSKLAESESDRLYHIANTNGITRIIVICHMTKYLDFVQAGYVTRESFSPLFLQVCCIEHEIVPLHELMTPEEVETELPKIRPEHLPSILYLDPVVRYYGWTQGIVRIHRKDGLYYRAITYDA